MTRGRSKPFAKKGALKNDTQARSTDMTKRRSTRCEKLSAMTDQELYRQLNRKYWGGRLPEYQVVRVDVITPFFRWETPLIGQCKHRERHILMIDLGDEKFRAVLLHEMVHVEFPDEGHSPRFRRRLHQIAEKEPLRGDEEVSRYRAYLDIVEADMKRLASRNPFRPYRSVARILARRRRCTIKRFCELAFDAGRSWRHFTRHQRYVAASLVNRPWAQREYESVPWARALQRRVARLHREAKRKRAEELQERLGRLDIRRPSPSVSRLSRS